MRSPSFLLLSTLCTLSYAEVPGKPDVNPALQQILNQAHQGPLYDYPTSFTQGIVPVSFSRLSLEEEGGN